MAHSVDNFKDLEELGIDCDDQLSNQFNEAANHLQTLLPNVDNQTLLTLYGYYKQGMEGPCNAPRPSWFDLKGKSKWEAWKKLQNMPQNEAKQLYIETIHKLDPTFLNNDNSSITTKESWVRVSVPMSEEKLTESEKSLIDYVKEGKSDKVEEILKTISSNQEILNKLDEEGLALIHWAADRGSRDILKLLLVAGTNINLQDSEGQTGLHYASSCGHIDCIELLMENGADLNILDNDGLSAKSVANDDATKQLLS